MPETTTRQAEHNAGAFIDPSGVGGGIPVPMRTLSDDYHDRPTEPEDLDRIPEPEPPGFIRRVIDRVLSRQRP